MYVMLCGYLPFTGKTEKQILTSVLNDSLNFPDEEWESVSREAKQLIKGMLIKDPEKRMSAEEAFNHPWIQDRALDKIFDKPICLNSLSNLVSFRSNLKLRHAALEFIVSHFSADKEIDQLRIAFCGMDKDGDGKLSMDELTEIASDSDCSKINVEKILEECDADGNGFIDYTEFLTATVQWHKSLNKEKLEAAFAAFDIDGDGYIDINEIKEMLGEAEQFDDEIWNQVLADADQNGDGVIDIYEFEQVLLNKGDYKQNELVLD